MMAILMYYWQDARHYKQQNRQLWWDMGYRRTLGDRVLDAIDRVRAWAWERKYAKWR